MKIRGIIDVLEGIAPLKYQESYDNSGLISGDPETDCTGVLIALDCTEELVREAIEKKLNLIVTHHPLIFRPIHSLVNDTAVGRCLMEAVRHNIIIYAIHTNLDNMIHGVNATIADRLNLVNRSVLKPQSDNLSVGAAMLGNLTKPVDEGAFLSLLREKFHSKMIRHSALTGRPVLRVAVCGGSGSSLISNALAARADFFVTADLKYHDFAEAEGRLVIADIGHFESEQFTTDLIYDLIHEKFPTFAVLKSGMETNPVHYYI